MNLHFSQRLLRRYQALAQEIMSVLFCKIFDELDTAPEDLPEFRASVTEDVKRIEKEIARIVVES